MKRRSGRTYDEVTDSTRSEAGRGDENTAELKPQTHLTSAAADGDKITMNDKQTPSSVTSSPASQGVCDYDAEFVKRVVQGNLIMYAMCFWIQQSCFPYMSKKLGVDNLTYGYLQTVFAVAQLLGGVVFGRFGDLMGARAALTLAYGCGIFSYGALAMATNISMLYLSRALAVFLACMQGSQMVITDIMPYEKRADALGKLGLFYGIGMVVGPFVGGQITKNLGEEAAALTAAIGSFISMIVVWYTVPKHVKHVKSEDQKVSNVFSISEVTRLLKNKEAAFLIIVKVVVGIPIGILQSMFSRVAMDQFKVEPDWNGMIMSYIGVIAMVVQGVGVGILTKKYTDKSLLTLSAFIAAVAYALMSQVSDIYQFCIAVLPLSAGMTTMQVVIGAAVTKTVSQQDTGAMIGLSMGTNSLIRTVSPTVGGIMLQTWGFSSIGYTGAVVCGVVSLLLYKS